MQQPNGPNAVENGCSDSNITQNMTNDSTSRRKGLYIEDAISKTNFGRFNYILIFTSGLVMSTLITEMIGITFVLPVSQCDLHLSTSEKGVLGTAGFFGIICSSHLWGFLADTQGRRRIMQPTLLAAFLTSIISSFVQNFYLLTTLRFLNGFFISASSGAIYVYLSEFHDSRQRSRVIMASSVIFGCLCISMPLLAWAVINQDWQFDVPLIGVTYKPWRLFLVVCSLPGLISYIILTFLPESPKFVLSQGKKAETYEILRTMNRINNGRDSPFEMFEIYEEGETVENRQRILNNDSNRFPFFASVWNQTVSVFKSPYLFSTVLICIIQFSISYTAQGFNVFFVEIINKMAANVNDLVHERVHMCDVINLKQIKVEDDGVHVEACMTKLELTMIQQGTILQALFAGGFFLVSLLINRISKFSIIFSILVGTGACGILCMWTNIPLLQIFLFTVHIASGVGSNVLNTTTVELFPTNLRAMAICISLMFGRLGSMAGSNLVAFLLENEYCELAFYISGLILIVAGILAYFLPNIHEKVINPQKS